MVHIHRNRQNNTEYEGKAAEQQISYGRLGGCMDGKPHITTGGSFKQFKTFVLVATESNYTHKTVTVYKGIRYFINRL